MRTLAAAPPASGFAPGAPGNYASNILWLDANQGLTLSGSNVLSWVDPKNSLNVASRSGAGAETALETAVQNGLNALRFDNRYMSLVFPAGDSWTTNGHLFFVAKQASAGEYIQFLMRGTGKPRLSASDRIYWESELDFFPGYGNGLTSGQREAWSIYELLFPIGSGSFRYNGSTLSFGGSGSNLGTGNFNRIGGGPDYAPNDCDFYLGEVAFFSEALTGEDYTAVYDYLSRWL
jgi:hypothetical protein